MIKQIVTLIVLIVPFLCFSQIKISGIVKDASTGELLVGATVVESNTNNGTATNANGYFSLLCKGNQIRASFIGYKKKTVICGGDTLISILLDAGQEIAEVNVRAQTFQKFNTSSLSVAELKNIPAIGGKPDVLKTLQLMPGIQSQGEGTSLINVRGGNPGENLYLIDDVQLLYVNHLGGFMSVFNPDMINSLEVYKGGFPAKYGGKLSSVMAITQREGNNKKWMGNLGLGITDASFSVEGPLFNDKSSLIVTGRKTFTEPIMWTFLSIVDNGSIMTYGFHDINAKFTYRPNTKNSYHINFYQGDDYLRFSNTNKHEQRLKVQAKNVWGNWLLSGRWSRVVSSRLFVNNIVSYTNYRLKVDNELISHIQGDTLVFDSKYLSGVNSFSLRSDWQYRVLMNYNVEFGAKYSAYRHIPNKIFRSDNSDNEFEQINSSESAAYMTNKIKLFRIIDAELGLRAVLFQNEGYSMKAFEPRVNVNLRFLPNQTLNYSYQKVNQFAHLLLTSGAIMNNEIWVPVDNRLEPSRSVQYSAGWKGSFAKGMFDSELNVYYKELNNLATYKEGYANLLGDGGWRSKIETGGLGKSKGVEFIVRKNSGEWTGFLTYCYSKTSRHFDGINRGEEFVFDYDRPHSASINFNRKLSDKWSVSITWIYQTGLPYTPVIGRQYMSRAVNGWSPPLGIDQYDEVLVYGERNSARMEDYHRLDLGCMYKKTTKKGRRAEWNFSIYNAYNRLNAISYYYSPGEETYSNYDLQGNYQYYKKYKVSFLPLVPSVSYKLYFEENSDSKSKGSGAIVNKIKRLLSYDKN